MNPWKDIELDDYENHMSLKSVSQLQAMNQMMKGQFYTYPSKSIMILGIAGGNGLEHIDINKTEKVYGVDINQKYLEQCDIRFPQLKSTLETIYADLTAEELELPQADLLIANLLIEYIGYSSFRRVVCAVKPEIVSCIIQINISDSFVSDSPYIHVFDGLEKVHNQMDKDSLIQVMRNIGYSNILCKEQLLPNGKKLVQMDFSSL